jgi:hypothetical protein
VSKVVKKLCPVCSGGGALLSDFANVLPFWVLEFPEKFDSGTDNGGLAKRGKLGSDDPTL